MQTKSQALSDRHLLCICFSEEGRGTIVDGRLRAADCVDLAPSRRLRQPLQKMAALDARGTCDKGDSRLVDRLLHGRHRALDAQFGVGASGRKPWKLVVPCPLQTLCRPQLQQTE